MTDELVPKKKSNAGRKPIPEDQKKKYKQPGLSLRPEQITNLHNLAGALGITSRSGVNFGNSSWRTMIAELAEIAPAIIEAIEEHNKDPERTFRPIRITPNVMLVIGPTPEPDAPEEVPTPAEPEPSTPEE